MSPPPNPAWPRNRNLRWFLSVKPLRGRNRAALRSKALEGTPKLVAERFKQSIARGVAAGESPLALMRRMDEVGRQTKDFEVARAAETETQVAYGTAQDAALSAVGFKRKKWLSMRDERVRDSHEKCDAQGPIPVDHKFVNGLRFPGEPNAPASEVIGCRCYLIGVD